jgi:citrate synthase
MTPEPQKALLQIDGKTIELPILMGTDGRKAVDISKLYDEHRITTYDPSLASTSVCQSAITYVDGDKGILSYRGIPIEQFDRPRPNFVEVAWLLIFGSLPTQSELADFRERLTSHEMLHESLRDQFSELPPKSPPMAILAAMFSQLACYHEKFLPLGDEELFVEAATRLLSKARTIAAYSYRRSQGLPYTYPDPMLRYCANFLHLMFSIPYQQYIIGPEIEDAMNLVLILHADHEQNCSTSTVRTVGSARANLFASCAAGVSALWGPLHGGANVEVIRMLEMIHSGGISPEECLRAAKNKENSFKLFGFGHRVYKNYDPRAKILQAAADRVFALKDTNHPLLAIARKLEELVLKDSYLVERKLYPNVDFYSGLLLRALGIPMSMFTVIFALGRLPGWIAQWKEQHDTPGQRIYRPRQLFIGEMNANYIPIEERGEP